MYIIYLIKIFTFVIGGPGVKFFSRSSYTHSITTVTNSLTKFAAQLAFDRIPEETEYEVRIGNAGLLVEIYTICRSLHVYCLSIDIHHQLQHYMINSYMADCFCHIQLQGP